MATLAATDIVAISSRTLRHGRVDTHGMLIATDGVAVKLRDALTKNAVRVIDLFREWDTDGNGSISKREFRKAIPRLGLKASKAEVGHLFDEWDADKSGMISLAELIQKLSR